MVETTASKIERVYDGLKLVQLEKNKRYGDSALYPLGIFSKVPSNEQIKCRLDDKLSRVRNSDVLRKNDTADLVGYLVLLMISEGWTEFEDLID